MSHVAQFFAETSQVASKIDYDKIEELVAALAQVRTARGRLFCLGVGGSAGNCSHAVNDFRKLCGLEAYAPTDNVAELTARTNDEGWETVFSEWLKTSRLSNRDALFVFSVGGGNVERRVSINLVHAVDLARERGAKVFGVVGRDGGYVGKFGDTVVIIPTVSEARITPHAEAFQAVVWHCVVSHPKLQQIPTKW